MGGKPYGQAGGHLPAGSLVAGYRLEEQVGAGGMAVVYRAWDVRLGRVAAVKVLAPAVAADEEFRHRFLRESRAAAAVDDPHIIPVYEAGEADGVLFIAMRYVPGGDVESLLGRTGPLTSLRAAGIISAVASALDAAHEAGLVHRDVKPANILVDARPGRPVHVYLSDFGLSKATLPADGLTVSGQSVGTPGYAAPEQLAGRAADGRADQYSLACTAFELLTGSPPFPRDQMTAVIWAHMSQLPPRLTSLRPGLPALVDGVLARGLAKAPRDRHGSCGQFADALRAALGLPPYDCDASDSPLPTLAAARPAAPGRVIRAAAAAQEALAGPATLPRVAAGGYIADVNDRPQARHPARRARHRHQATGAAAAPSGRAGRATRPPSRADRARDRTTPGHGWRPAMFLAVALAAASVACVTAPMLSARQSRAPAAHPAALTMPISRYLGVYEPGAPPSYRSVARFARVAGHQPELVGYFSNWGRPFDASFAETLHEHAAIPLVQIDPVSVSLSAIAAGDDDGYLREYADAVARFGHAVIIGFGHEMNARWYSWGDGHVSPSTFVAAWRHVVNLFRQQGADNVTWLWTIQAARSAGAVPVSAWWPGAQYVTWIGIDGYYHRQSDTFGSVFGPTIERVRTFTRNPILISRTAVAPRPSNLTKVLDLFRGMAAYHTLGLVWFDIDQHHGTHNQDWRVEDSHVAEYALRLGVAEYIAPVSRH